MTAAGELWLWGNTWSLKMMMMKKVEGEAMGAGVSEKCRKVCRWSMLLDGCLK